MKLIIAIIRPEYLDAVRACLKTREACIISIFHVFSDGPEPPRTAMYRGAPLQFRSPKLRVDIAVKDPLVEPVIDAIVRAGYSVDSLETGEVKVLALPLDSCLLSAWAAEDGQPLDEVQDVRRADRPHRVD